MPPYTDNPFSEVTSKRLRIEDAKPIFIFDEKTEFSFLQAADGWEFAAHFLMAKTGMRPGEVNHLLIEEVDLEAGWLHIRNKPELCWQVKTREKRNVPLCDALKAVLVKQIGGRKAGPVFVRPDFQATGGEPPTRRQMQRQLERRVAVAERERDTAVSREERAALATAVWRERVGDPFAGDNLLINRSRNAGMNKIANGRSLIPSNISNATAAIVS